VKPLDAHFAQAIIADVPATIRALPVCLSPARDRRRKLPHRHFVDLDRAET
jgi:hypothetical protein